MGRFSTLGIGLRAHQRTIAATLAAIGIALGVFFAGTWAGSSGALTFGPVIATASEANDAPAPDLPESDMCSGTPMPGDTAGPHMPMPGGVPSGKAGPGMSPGAMCADLPMDKMAPGMPMDTPMHDKMCCDKK